MKSEKEIQNVLRNLPLSGETNYNAMTYEEGIEETLMWILDEISDEEFSYTLKH